MSSSGANKDVLFGKKVLVTGGSGYFGRRLIEQLLRAGVSHVHNFDLSPIEERKIAEDVRECFRTRVRSFRGDIREATAVREAARGTELVFHIASFGMSGTEMLNRPLVESINTGGTAVLLEVCAELGVRTVVYTSTNNVVFDTRTPLQNVDESYAYPEVEDYLDAYSCTKALAEKLVIAANGTRTRSRSRTRSRTSVVVHQKGNVSVTQHNGENRHEHRGDNNREDNRHGDRGDIHPRDSHRAAEHNGEDHNSQATRDHTAGKEAAETTTQETTQEEEEAQLLSTCSLRAAGIYGEGEERHIPRIAYLIDIGFGWVRFGPLHTRCDWIYVDNLVHAHLLAARSLLENGVHSVAAGECFFVSDCQPMNQFEFLRPLYERYGGRFPPFLVPTAVVMAGAYLAELVHHLLRPVCRVAPFLTRMEVSKITCTHYFSTKKIQRLLGYKPLVSFEEGIKRTVDHLLDDPSHQRHRSLLWPILLAVIALLLAVLVTLLF